ncbi:MAG: hypothetical protein PHR38_01430 [Bacteroidales bacterium]|nr:hypothetical protein [Bacteroidales bacterium]MDD4712433.1 hypothetical protein [Bacteroidales bacterium]
MNRIIVVLFLFFPFSVHSQSELNTIKKVGENVYISSRIDKTHEINFWFKKCMANDLFTFYRVSMVDASDGITIVNEAYSDNIGPFDILNGGWCGGNHLFSDGKTKTAETFSVKLYADGRILSSDTTLKAHTVKIEVRNNIFNPLSASEKETKIYFTDTLCIEKAIYIVNNNSIQVDLSHVYTNTIPVTIVKYYGMQSMFKDEKQLLTPLGKYKYWTAINKTDRFIKKDFPRFNQYIEKSDSCFQSSYLFNRDLGTHSELPDDDVIFIGNSWSKCYHKLIGNAHRIAGNSDSWSGVYTWLTTPLLNTEFAFAYDGFMDGKQVIFFSNNKKGDFIIPLPEKSKRNKIKIIENKNDIKIKKKNQNINISCNGPGRAIISFEK